MGFSAVPSVGLQAYSDQLAALSQITVSAAGLTILSAADAVAQRTALGLGTFAVENIASVPSLVMADSANIAANTNAGTKIGTAANQKFGFFNAMPIVQPSGAAQAAISLADVTTLGVADPIKVNTALTDIGTLLGALRGAMVSLGLMKGST